VYRHSAPGKFLHPFSRRFTAKALLFDRAALDSYLANGGGTPPESA
jgi:hypothetical protein